MLSVTRTRLIVSLALVTALALTGCVGDAEPVSDPSNGSTPVPTASTAESETEVSEGDVESSSDGSSGDSGGSGSEDTAGGGAASPSATSEPPVAATGPTAAVTNQKCSSGKLIITLTANADNSYRKGITAVTLERQNEYDAWLDSAATWLGPETGQGNQWTGDLPGNQQNIGKTLRVTVVGSTGTTTLTLPITAPC